MDVKKELLSDITASLDLLVKYSDLDKKEIQSLISSVVNGTKNKNLIDLFVMREFIKDKTSSILAADIDQDRAQMQEATDGVDFGTDDMGGNATEDAVSKEEKEDFENRKQELLDKAEGYLESIDLGINNIENGDVNLELVGQLIDLKSLIQDSLDAVNEADSAEENDDKKLNILEAVLNNLEPNGEDGDTSLEDIIKNVSGGAVDADTEISTLVKKLNDIVENPEEYLNKSEESEFGDETPEDFDAVGEDEERAEEEEEEEESEKPSPADEYVEDVKEKDKAAKGEDSDEDEDTADNKKKQQVTSSRRRNAKSGVVSGEITPEEIEERYTFDDGFNDDEDYDAPASDADYDDIEDPFAWDENDYAAAGRMGGGSRGMPAEDSNGIYGEDYEDDDFGEEPVDDDTSPYVDEVDDIDFGASDIPSKYKDPKDTEEEDRLVDDLKTDISDLKDSFSEKLDALEDKYSDLEDDDADDGGDEPDPDFEPEDTDFSDVEPPAKGAESDADIGDLPPEDDNGEETPHPAKEPPAKPDKGQPAPDDSGNPEDDGLLSTEENISDDTAIVSTGVDIGEPAVASQTIGGLNTAAVEGAKSVVSRTKGPQFFGSKKYNRKLARKRKR